MNPGASQGIKPAALAALWQWSKTVQDDYFILATSTLPKRRKRLENLRFVYDYDQGKTVKDYEIWTLGLLTPRNFLPVNFGRHFPQTPRKTRRDLLDV
jgi:hypothetical protein